MKKIFHLKLYNLIKDFLIENNYFFNFVFFQKNQFMI